VLSAIWNCGWPVASSAWTPSAPSASVTSCFRGIRLAVATAAVPSGASFLGHPRGLLFLSFTEVWERFSFYGMQALLVLYMVDQALTPGHIHAILGMGAFRGGLEAV